jgi:ABC-type glycerol-3-phosphate transport system substrate-binding protein
MIKVVCRPSGANGIRRSARTQSDSPDVIRASNFQQRSSLRPGGILPMTNLSARDKIDVNDWLIPLEQTKVNGKLGGYSKITELHSWFIAKSRFAEAQVTTPPSTYDEVGALGGQAHQRHLPTLSRSASRAASAVPKAFVDSCSALC